MKQNFQKNESFPGKYHKFDETGSYTHYPGTTIVSFLANQKNLFSDFRYWIVTTKPTFTKYYSMLDDESYHATIKNNTVGSTDLSKFDVVAMKIACKTPPCQYLVASAKRGPYFRGTFGINLDFVGEFKEIVEKVRSDLVKLGSFPEPNFQFHMTFAYAYKNLPQDNDPIKSALNDEFNAISQKLYQMLSSCNFEILFGGPTFCTFENMNSFIPIPDPREKYVIRFVYDNKTYVFGIFTCTEFPMEEFKEYVKFLMKNNKSCESKMSIGKFDQCGYFRGNDIIFMVIQDAAREIYWHEDEREVFQYLKPTAELIGKNIIITEPFFVEKTDTPITDTWAN